MKIESWIFVGTTMIGVGVGFFLFHLSVFYFVGSIVAGAGIGFLIDAIISRK